MQLKGIHHIALNVTDLDRSEHFYTDVLGFNVTHRFSKGLRHIMLDTGNALLALFETPDLNMESALEQLSDKGYMHFAFETNREEFIKIIDELKDKKVPVDSGPVVRGEGESIYFKDPDQNHLEIRCDAKS
ncbi:MAG: VOC family protein [Nitrospina sp.]|jgi:glyoxylase I family protein|nr:VOC family protein [Nitrospina sp.]MBT3509167.1 VOC family protein [Nitrospina sp.]MBT3874917.1 VOC family protein [Nitrospina sp.]MBT4048452.1 VOC family protein [Nitrospina sp.]MBT4558661.1 VOC family protein [Nitrospina sp.]